MNIFESAVRNKIRFPSVRGELTVEQLWDVPLRAQNDFNLNTIAKAVNKDLKALSEENFVGVAPTTAYTRQALVMQVVKWVIDTKLAEEETAKKSAAKKQEKQKLLAILAEKQDGKLSELSIEDLQKRIAALED